MQLCDTLALSFNTLISLDWLEFIKTAASVVMAGIAVLALKNWQRQDKAKREAEFLDALIEATHTYLVEIARPISLVEMARIGMMSQVSSLGDEEEAAKIAKGAIPYIKTHGERDAKQLWEALNDVRPASIKLRSLSSKGQVFEFHEYAKCQKAIAMLVWQFERMEAFATIIGWPTANWKHLEVQRALENILTVEPTNIRKHLGGNNVAILEYVRETYARLYGSFRRRPRAKPKEPNR